MKNLLILIALFGLFSCSNDPIDELKVPINPEIEVLNNAFVGTWDLHDFISPYTQFGNEGSVVLGNMPDYISYGEAQHTLNELSVPIKLTSKYVVTYKDNILYADKYSASDNTVEHMTWEIVLQKSSGTNSPVQYTDHQFKILEKDSDGVLTRTYDVIQFNLDKDSLREFNVPKYSFQVNSDYDSYNSYVPYPSVCIIRFNRK
jgi:hypothetical protein